MAAGIIELTRTLAEDEGLQGEPDTQLLSPAMFAERCSIGKTQAYEVLRAPWPHGPRTVHIGTSLRVSVAAIREWLRHKELEESQQ
jgi:hypothetical protein